MRSLYCFFFSRSFCWYHFSDIQIHFFFYVLCMLLKANRKRAYRLGHVSLIFYWRRLSVARLLLQIKDRAAINIQKYKNMKAMRTIAVYIGQWKWRNMVTDPVKLAKLAWLSCDFFRFFFSVDIWAQRVDLENNGFEFR